MSEQKAVRDNEGKIDYTIIPWEGFEDVVKAFKQGEKDYGRNNYQKGDGLTLQSYRESMFRHLIASDNGIEFDEKSGADHIAHLAANCLMYLWQKQHERKRNTSAPIYSTDCPECSKPFFPKEEDVMNCPNCGVELIRNSLYQRLTQ